MGAEITAAYPDGDLLVLGLLKGSFIFLSDLVRQITRPLQVDFLVLSSYGTETSSSGHVRLLYDPAVPVEDDRHDWGQTRGTKAAGKIGGALEIERQLDHRTGRGNRAGSPAMNSPRERSQAKCRIRISDGSASIRLNAEGR